jgi:hypothetical protein
LGTVLIKLANVLFRIILYGTLASLTQTPVATNEYNDTTLEIKYLLNPSSLVFRKP